MYYLIPADIIALLEAFIVLFSLWLKEVHSVRSGAPGIMPATFKFTEQKAKGDVNAGKIKNTGNVFSESKVLKSKADDNSFEKIKTSLSRTVSKNEAAPSSG